MTDSTTILAEPDRSDFGVVARYVSCRPRIRYCDLGADAVTRVETGVASVECRSRM
jgi:hypothetical protein